MTELLDTNLRVLFNDRELLPRVVRSVQLDQGCEYVTALEQLHEAADHAFSEGQPTLRRALHWARADADYVVDSVKLLERRDAVVQAAYEKAAKPFLLERTDPRGMVLLDQASNAGNAIPSGCGGEPPTDVGKALASPVEFERRFARMRTVGGRSPLTGQAYDTTSRDQFRDDDRLNLDAGIDMVRTAERAIEEQAAAAEGNRVAAQLDAAIATAADKRAKLAQLDAEIANVTNGKRAERNRLKNEAAAADKTLTLLDHAGAGKPKKGKKTSGRKLDKRVRKRLARLGLPERDYVIALEAETRGEPMPPSSAAPPPAAPPGVHAGSYAIDQQVRARMHELGAPDSAYPQVLEQVLKEG